VSQPPENSKNSASIDPVPEIRLLGGLRDVVGERAMKSSATVVRALLEEISTRGGDAAAVLLYDETGTAPSQDLRILVNGRSISFLARLDTTLCADDTVTVHLAGARGYPGG
jgi:molybdopterin converting factor small subunit